MGLLLLFVVCSCLFCFSVLQIKGMCFCLCACVSLRIVAHSVHEVWIRCHAQQQGNEGGGGEERKMKGSGGEGRLIEEVKY